MTHDLKNITLKIEIHTVGIILVSVSVVADAFLPNFQERVFDQGSSRNEVI